MNQLKIPKLKIIWVIALMFFCMQTRRSVTCSKGCLKCLSTGECVLCDIVNGYARISGTCIVSKLDNCTNRLFNGECLACEVGYFLDLGKCVSAGSNVLNNCRVYFTATSCQICAEEHYLVNGQCQRVKQVIPDCIYYNSIGSKCSECKAGLILSLDLLNCNEVQMATPVANCLSYNQIGCRECKSGYMVNLNKVAKKANGSI